MTEPENPEAGQATAVAEETAQGRRLEDVPADELFGDEDAGQEVETKPDKPPDADKAEVKAPAQTPEAEPEFDPKAWGLDPEKFKGCKTPREAMALLNRQYAELHKKLGEQSAEVRAARQARVESEGRETAPERRALAEWRKFQALQQSDPARANEMYQDWLDSPTIGGAGVAAWQHQAALEEIEERAERDRQAHPPVDARMAVEVELFTAAHKDWPRYKEAMQEVADDLGYYPPYETAYALAKADPDARRTLVALMKSAELDYDDAVVLAGKDDESRSAILALVRDENMPVKAAAELVDLRKKKEEFDKGATGRADALVAEAKKVGAPGARSAGQGDLSKKYRRLEDVPAEEMFDE